NKPRALVAFLLMAAGILWSIDNRPFTRELGLAQYKNEGVKPYQKLIDYVHEKGGGSAAMIWSAPEASMNDSMNGVSLYSEPYLRDVKNTFAHNGMAGVYGDAVTALRPGGEWDEMLLEYCAGKRKVLPVIVGELDYHGRKRRMGMYQTVVRSAEKNRSSVYKAIVKGRSYAYAKPTKYGIELREAYLKRGTETASLGETLPASREPTIAVLELTAVGDVPANASFLVSVVANGKLAARKSFKDRDIRIEIPLPSEFFANAAGKLGYARFDITLGSARIATNPIFIENAEGRKCSILNFQGSILNKPASGRSWKSPLLFVSNLI
ncbi:MAG: hypothetical protein KAG97_11455, partial [Victivallales bacterium]|nr:hypothetical protein [Victivallales bacterium]